jgi:hypothetical protein
VNNLRVLALAASLFAISGCATPASSGDTSGKTGHHIGWEYKVVMVPYIGDKAMEERATLFNTFGNEGWEYAGSYKAGGGDGQFEVIFKRPKARP